MEQWSLQLPSLEFLDDKKLGRSKSFPARIRPRPSIQSSPSLSPVPGSFGSVMGSIDSFGSSLGSIDTFPTPPSRSSYTTTQRDDSPSSPSSLHSQKSYIYPSTSPASLKSASEYTSPDSSPSLSDYMDALSFPLSFPSSDFELKRSCCALVDNREDCFDCSETSLAALSRKSYWSDDSDDDELKSSEVEDLHYHQRFKDGLRNLQKRGSMPVFHSLSSREKKTLINPSSTQSLSRTSSFGKGWSRKLLHRQKSAGNVPKSESSPLSSVL